MGSKLGAWITLRPFHKEGKLLVGASEFHRSLWPLDCEGKTSGRVAHG
jgi:hypothetical protein